MTDRRLPAEWEPQSGIMLTWPHANTDWASNLKRVEPVFSDICASTSHYEKVLIVVNSNAHQQHISDYIKSYNVKTENVVFAVADSNDSWARDHGAITILDENNKPLMLDYRFNGWGEKYSYELDNDINKKLFKANIFQAAHEQQDFILEGGSIDSNGAGTLLTTHCLLSDKRNTGMTQTEIENTLKNHLGVKQVHLLQHGHIVGDDTDAHIDTLARFVAPDTIAYVKCVDKSDEHYDSLQAMENELAALRTIHGGSYELVPLPLPEAIFNDDNERLPATYANFLIINQCVLLPVYGQARDKQAEETLKSCFPDRKIIAIDCLPLIKQFGSLHCITMQFPQGVLMA